MYSLKKEILRICARILGDEEKHAKEANTKGVVGQTGKISPTAPNPRNENPRLVRINDLIRKMKPRSLYNNE